MLSTGGFEQEGHYTWPGFHHAIMQRRVTGFVLLVEVCLSGDVGLYCFNIAVGSGIPDGFFRSLLTQA
jgi:hypothetical protein